MDKEQDKTIFRRRRSRFTAIGNAPLQDPRLSLEAVGFLVCIMSLPENWVFNRTWAKKRFSLGKERLARIIGELEAGGYVERRQEREADGRHGTAVYIFTDEPGQFGDEPAGGGDIPRPGEPRAGNPPTANRAHIKDYPKPKTENLEKDRGSAVRGLVSAAVRSATPYPRKRYKAGPEDLAAYRALAEGRLGG